MSDLKSLLSQVTKNTININGIDIEYFKPECSINNLYDETVLLLNFNNTGVFYLLNDKQKKIFSLGFICMMLCGKNEGILHSNYILSNLNHLAKNQDNRRIFLLNLFYCLRIFKSYYDNNKHIVKNLKESLNLIIRNFPEKKLRSMTLELVINLIVTSPEVDISNFEFEGIKPFSSDMNNQTNNLYLNIFLTLNDNKKSSKTLNDDFTRKINEFFNSNVTKNDSENLKKEKETIAENKVNKLKEFFLNEINETNQKEVAYELFIISVVMKEFCKYEEKK